MVGAVLALVVGVELPVLDVDVGHAVEQHLQLVGLEDSDELFGDDAVESLPDEVEGALHLLLAERIDAASRGQYQQEMYIFLFSSVTSVSFPSSTSSTSSIVEDSLFSLAITK